jgi:TrmH family RNA methyltransferase
LGTIIRTADAAGATGVVIVEPSVDLYDPQTVRATMGSLFALPIMRLADEDALPRWVDEARAAGLPLQVVASSAHATRVHYEADYGRLTVLLVGSERRGLPQPVREGADIQVRLPMSGRATSLNVAAATAALVYEIVRQRAITTEPDSSL